MATDNIEEKAKDQEEALREAMKKRLEEASATEAETTASEPSVETEQEKESEISASGSTVASEWGHVEEGQKEDEKPALSGGLSPEEAESLLASIEEGEKKAAAEKDEKGPADLPEKREEKPIEAEPALEARKEAMVVEEEKKIEEIEKRAREEAESKEEKKEEIKEEAQPAVSVQVPDAPDIPKSETQIQIESILFENLEDIFNSMDMKKQEDFKKKREETASKIEGLLKAAKTRIKEIIKLIREFLKIVPGLNRYFTEQEAKIKTDKMLGLKENRK